MGFFSNTPAPQNDPFLMLFQGLLANKARRKEEADLERKRNDEKEAGAALADLFTSVDAVAPKQGYAPPDLPLGTSADQQSTIPQLKPDLFPKGMGEQTPTVRNYNFKDVGGYATSTPVQPQTQRPQTTVGQVNAVPTYNSIADLREKIQRVASLPNGAKYLNDFFDYYRTRTQQEPSDIMTSYDASRGGVVTYNKKTGEIAFIKPPNMGEREQGQGSISEFEAFAESYPQTPEGKRQAVVDFNKLKLGGKKELQANASSLGVTAYGAKSKLRTAEEEQRAKIREGVKSMSPIQSIALVNRFDADPNVRKYKSMEDSAEMILDLASSGNPIANAAIPTFMARASGEVGNLSEADKAPFGGSRAIMENLQQFFSRQADGTLTQDNIAFVNSLSETMKNAAKRNLTKEASLRAKQYKRANSDFDEQELFYMLYPNGVYSGDESKNAQTQSKKKTVKLKSGKIIEVENEERKDN